MTERMFSGLNTVSIQKLFEEIYEESNLEKI